MQTAHQTREAGVVDSARGDRLEASTIGEPRVHRRRSRHRLRSLVPAVATLALASALVLTFRLVPSYDPYGWLVWGRQTIHWALNPAGAPSWKPMPWLLTTPLALAGGAAPTLWLILACASGLVALWLAYRLAARLGGAVAGVTAVVAVLLCQDWVIYTLTGNSEPFATTFALGAVDRHLAGQRRLALGLGTLVALTRPESSLVLAPYLLWLWRNEPRARIWEGVAALALPLLWFLPPYLAIGRRFNAGDPVFHTGLATPGPLTVIHRGATIVIWPVAIAAALALMIALRRGRSRGLALALAAGAGLWVTGVAVMAQAGFPAVQRFMLPAAAAGCVLAGAGVGWTAQWARRPARGRSRLVVVFALAVIAALSAWRAHFRITGTIRSIRDEQRRSEAVRSLDRAIARAGGADRLLACGSPTAVLAVQSTLAWSLNLAVGAVGFNPQRDLQRQRHVVLFAVDPSAAHGGDRRLLARAGRWRVVGVRARSGCFRSHA